MDTHYYMDVLLYSKKDRLLLNIAIVYVLIASGSQYFFRFHGTITQIGYLIFSLYFYFHFSQKPNKRSQLFVFIYCLYILINFYVINGNHSDSMRIWTYVIFAIGSYMIMSKIPWNVLADRLIRIVSYMATLSLIIFFISELNMVSPTNVVYKGTPFLMIFFHVIGWSQPFHRLAGIYWEPGAYQIVLNSTLLVAINYFYKNKSISPRNYLRYLIPIIISSLMTLSTTGYIVLFLLAVYFFYQKNISKKKSFKKVAFLSLSAIILSFSAYLIYISSPVQDKLEQLESGGANSAMIRQADNLALLQMITEKPLFGYGLASIDFERRSDQLDNLTSSNGDLFFAALFGIPFYIFVLYICFCNANKLSVPPIFNTILFVSLNMGECFLYYPLVFIFLIFSPYQINKR